MERFHVLRVCFDAMNRSVNDLKCAGELSGDGAFALTGSSSQSGAVLRVPPHSKVATGDLRFRESFPLEESSFNGTESGE